MATKTSDASPLNVATAKLRAWALSREEGTFLGSEGELLLELGAARATLKQAARSLEREGLVRVKRGVGGGYYSARPTEDTLKPVVNAYLETIDVRGADTMTVTTILWLEVVRRASRACNLELRQALLDLVGELAILPDDASFADVDAIEQAGRRAIFAHVDCRYIELIIHLNQAFGARHQHPPHAHNGTSRHFEFVTQWRKAKSLELQSIADGDTRLAAVAARNCRTIWNRRVSGDECPVDLD